MNGDRVRIVCFSCRFGWQGTEPPAAVPSAELVWLPLVCGGRLDVESLLTAFRDGADGVLVAVCPVGECHFQEGNLQVLKRVTLLRPVLVSHGFAGERLRIIAGRDADGSELLKAVTAFAEELSPHGTGTV